MPIMGRRAGGPPAELPLNAAGTAVLTEGTGGTLPTGGATAANQATEIASLSSIDTKLTDGSAKTKTSLPTSTHIGANANPNGSAVQFGSQATTIGIAIFKALIGNTAAVFIGRATGVTTSTGIPLEPGDSITLPCANINEYYVISAASQNIRALAL